MSESEDDIKNLLGEFNSMTSEELVKMVKRDHKKRKRDPLYSDDSSLSSISSEEDNNKRKRKSSFDVSDKDVNLFSNMTEKDKIAYSEYANGEPRNSPFNEGKGVKKGKSRRKKGKSRRKQRKSRRKQSRSRRRN